MRVTILRCPVYGVSKYGSSLTTLGGCRLSMR